MGYPQQKLQKTWIQDGINAEIIEWTKSFGEYLSNNEDRQALSTAQLRRFFGEVKRIESDLEGNKEDIYLLKPMLAYAVGRDRRKIRGAVVNSTKIDVFAEELTKAIEAIRVKEYEHVKNDFKNFINIFESIVAYHKFYSND